MFNNDYHFKLQVFEGPLDLLLHLIKLDEIQIEQVILARITTQYLEYIKTLESLNITMISEFTVMATHLLYLKSKSLLPQKTILPDDSSLDDELSPQSELIHQLLEYKKFKNAAETLATQQENQSAFIPNKPISAPPQETQQEDDFLYNLKAKELCDAFHRCLARLEQAEPTLVIQQDPYSVSDKTEWILNQLQKKQTWLLRDILDSAKYKAELITLFLALLELLKTDQVRSQLKQEELEIVLPLTKTVV